MKIPEIISDGEKINLVFLSPEAIKNKEILEKQLICEKLEDLRFVYRTLME